jgi:hypothetical protein
MPIMAGRGRRRAGTLMDFAVMTDNLGGQYCILPQWTTKGRYYHFKAAAIQQITQENKRIGK